MSEFEACRKNSRREETRNFRWQFYDEFRTQAPGSGFGDDMLQSIEAMIRTFLE